ncbi:MAG: RHS repeat-associated core domain-containing protein, partial [Thermoanaerobaculia bacterium]
LRRTYPGNVQVSFTYSPTGRRLTATDARGVTTYGYDNRDRVTSLVYPDGRSLEYSYDAAGNRTALTANVASRTLTTSYTYDDLNRLDTVTDPNGGVYNHNYDANGNRSSLLFPNGVATTYAYNAKNQLLNISTINNAGTTLVSFAYTLTPSGNRTKIVEHDGITRNYSYDSLYRLTDEHVRQGTAPDAPTAWRNQFAYDPVGNRLEQIRQTESGTPQPVVYTYDDRDRLLTESGIAGPVTYGWDANGNQTAKSGSDGATYAWDTENRLVRVELVNGTVVEHYYDVDGTRVRTTTTPSGGAPEAVGDLVDPWHQTSAAGRGLILSQVVAETDDTGALTAYHARGDDLLATLRPDVDIPSNLAAKYFHAEGIGTIRALTNQAGEPSDSYTLEAFGTLLTHQGDGDNAFLFAGEALDQNLGFYYNRARWMDAGAGAFVSSDSYAGLEHEPASLHKYLYAHANPVRATDPTGHTEFMVSLAIVGATLGAIYASGTFPQPTLLGKVRVALLGATVGALLGWAVAYWGAGAAAVGGSAAGVSVLATEGLSAGAARYATATGTGLQHGFRHVNTALSLGNWNNASREAFRAIVENALQFPTHVIENWVMSRGGQTVNIFLQRIPNGQVLAVYLDESGEMVTSTIPTAQQLQTWMP